MTKFIIKIKGIHLGTPCFTVNCGLESGLTDSTNASS